MPIEVEVMEVAEVKSDAITPTPSQKPDSLKKWRTRPSMVLEYKSIRPWQKLVSLVVIASIATGVLLIFSDVFKTGDDLIAKLGFSSTIRNYIAYVGVATFVALYMLDISYWPGQVGAFLRRLMTLVVIAIFLAAALVSQVSMPYVPLAVCLLALPFAALFMGGTIFKKNDKGGVAKWMGVVFLLSALYTLILWAVWFTGNIGGGGGVMAWAAKRSQFSQLANCNAKDASGKFIMANRQVCNGYGAPPWRPFSLTVI